MVSEDDLEPLDTALFREPEGYYEPPKPPTYAEHTLSSGEVLKLRLVGHNPLWVTDDALAPSGHGELNCVKGTPAMERRTGGIRISRGPLGALDRG